uniref:Insecticidal crystal toxin domain-containing protein n=1 Tax=Noccaea caerulescens TaxID=107243 RepID=A0A1J3JQ69_NOCCA
MYVTKRLSEYQRNPSELTLLPSEGPNSGVLVIQDEESQPTCCFGKCFDCNLNGLPFPQNAKLTVRYQIGSGEDKIVLLDSVAFIPVLHQPPSSNLYYVIRRRGKHTGEACVSAKEGDRVSCCICFSYVSNAEPRPLDPFDVYQQFEIHQRGSSTRKFFATSVASDGIPPRFLRRKGWTVPFSSSEDYGLVDDAKGIVDAKLRYELPGFDKSVVVGKWYVPFLFVKEGDAKDQMKKSMYYSMTLHQRFEEVFFCENVDDDKQFEVVVDVEVETEVVKLEGEKIARETKGVASDGVVWFSTVSGTGQEKIGLGIVVLERMKWEEERFGWSKMSSNIKRSERFEGGSSHWKSYRCYVLVESFELKRSDESLVLRYEFKHVDKLKSKWD